MFLDCFANTLQKKRIQVWPNVALATTVRLPDLRNSGASYRILGSVLNQKQHRRPEMTLLLREVCVSKELRNLGRLREEDLVKICGEVSIRDAPIVALANALNQIH